MTRPLSLFMLKGADKLVREVCAAENLDPDILERLLAVEQDFAGMARRRGIFDAIDAALEANPDDTQ